MKLLKAVIAFILLLSSFSYTCVYGDENDYQVYNVKEDVLSSFSTYSGARSFYLNNKDNYDNLVISYQGKVIEMEYGVISFDTGEGCELDSEYYSLTRSTADYLNGCYGDDALYLYSDYMDDEVYFYLNGEEGSIDINDVTLIPYSDEITVSSYQVYDGELYHNIKGTMENNYYRYSNLIGVAPEYLNENTIYYSYDGFYFYDDFKLLSEDYLNDIRINSINEDPFYNYYQYVSFKSETNYTSEELNDYLSNGLGYTDYLTSYHDDNLDGANDTLQESQLYNSGSIFLANQNVYGVNATMLLASGLLESDYGKSLASFESNNIYSMSAYSGSAQASKKRYKSIEQCVNNFSSLVINGYFSKIRKDYYSGAYYGNKSSGFTANYSLDPYYGEKAASFYYQIDKYLGFKDYNAYSIGHIRNDFRYYNDKELTDKLVTIDTNDFYVTIYKDKDLSYKILLENNDYAYVNKEDVDIVSDGNLDRDLISYNLDFDGGNYNGNETLTISSTHEINLKDIVPSKDGYEFTGYELVEDTYVAQYKQIDSIIEYYSLDKTLEENDYLNLKDKAIYISYTNGSNNVIYLNSNLISSYINDEVGDSTVDINYCGMTISHEYSVKDNDITLNNQFYEALNNETYNEIKKDYLKSSVNLDYETIRNLDNYYFEKNKRNYIIENNIDDNLSYSGLDLSLPDKKTFSLFEDVYYVTVDPVNDSDLKKVMDLASKYGFEEVANLNISFKFNYEELKLQGSSIVSLTLDSKQGNSIYTVYHIDENGVISKCYSTQTSNMIKFKIKESGNYVVLRKHGFNNYSFEDYDELLTQDKSGIDNNKINVEFLVVVVLVVTNFIGLIVYYLLNDQKDKRWKEFKKSLLTVDFAREGKRKN